LIHDLIDDFIDAPWKVPGKEKDMQVESTSATVSNSPQVSTSTQKYPQVLTRMIRHGIFLPLTHLDTN
jgi:hypothetical protein